MEEPCKVSRLQTAVLLDLFRILGVAGRLGMERGSTVSACMELWSGLESVNVPPHIKAACSVCCAGMGVINNLVPWQVSTVKRSYAHEVLHHDGMEPRKQADQESCSLWRT